jgi:hypothetical protein
LWVGCGYSSCLLKTTVTLLSLRVLKLKYESVHKLYTIRLFSLCLWSDYGLKCESCHRWFDCWCQRLPNV